jgi:hypothetical protein
METEEKEIIFTIIKNLIEAGMQVTSSRRTFKESLERKCDKQVKFLEDFWEIHKKKFKEMGFENLEIGEMHHPLSMAFNTIYLALHWEEERDKIENGQRTQFFIDGNHTTGPVSYKTLSKTSKLSEYSVKNILESLVKDGFLKRSFYYNSSHYFYWI